MFRVLSNLNSSLQFPPIKMKSAFTFASKQISRNYVKSLKDLNVKPSTPIKLWQCDKKEITTEELFPKDKKVVVIGLPGAYTPVCSTKHIPSFVKNYDALRKAGVHKIYCVSVNDPFVMEAWAKDQKVDGKVEFLADAHGEFTRQIGAEVDLKGFLGKRSDRYTLIVENGKVTHSNVESAIGECTVSEGSYLVNQLLKK